MLNQFDHAKNSNKFYVLQLIESDSDPKQYHFFTRWGRVGEKGQLASAPCASLPAALKEFEKKFKDKTKNDWLQRANFTKVNGKYELLERDYGTDDPPQPAPSVSGEAPREAAVSKLDSRVQSFISQIADVSMMESHMREIGYDTTRAPLGKMKKETVLRGYEVLKQLSVVIMGATGASSSGSGASSGASGGGGSSGRSLSGSDREAIEALTNSFYSVIPHASPRNVKLPLISTPQLLKEKIEMVEALGEIEIFSRTMDTKDPSFDVHPIDNKYAQLGIKLTPVDVGSSLHVLLDEYMQNTHAATHANYKLELTQAFEVEREGEAARFKDSIGNIQLLWHGSRLTNWCGILGQGLRIAPPEAPVTGYMFGKGVYFANASSKSANYCFANQQSPGGVLLLSEVALGSQYERLRAEYEADDSRKKAGKQSTWGKGRTAPAPAGTVPLPGAPSVVVPKGKHAPTNVKDSSLMYDEFIVYDLAQIKQRFVLQVKFVY